MAKLIDLTGMQFGDWEVIKYAGDRRWLCKCSCGKVVEVLGNALRRGTSKSCGHNTTAFKDIKGMQFGEWVVIDYVGKGYYNCKCSCGVQREVSKYHLLSGRTKSCGHSNGGGFTNKEYIDKNTRISNSKIDSIRVGDIIGDWEILERKENSYWLCKCSCGKESLVHDWSLKIGRSKSCGHNLLEDLTNREFGEWKVIDYAGNSYWNCECSCGKRGRVKKTDLLSGSSKSCGHNRFELKLDLTGRKFGMLTVKEYKGKGFYECLCECGEITHVLSGNLLNGGTQSCGCKHSSKYTEEYIKVAIDNYIKATGEKPYRIDLANLLGAHPGYVGRLLNKYELADKINTEFRSRYEREICEYIKEIRGDIKILTNNKSILNGYELDIYIPELKIAIEFNGDYWHSMDNKDRYYHQNKTLMCIERDIHLIHIFEYEWTDENTKYKLKSILRNNIGLGNRQIIYARNCQIKTVCKEDEERFLNDNHLQNYANSTSAYGLYYKDDLVSLMSFIKPRFNKEYDIELLRYCIDLNKNVVGGAEKLFKAAITEINPNSVVTYCDISKFTGRVYDKLGFIKQDITAPNYKWIGNGEVLSRYKTQKSKLIADGYAEYGNTEDEIMVNRGYIKIYDSGNLRLSWPASLKQNKDRINKGGY